MRTLIRTVGLVAALLTPMALQAKGAALSSADYEEIQNLYAKYTHAFDSGDGQAVANVYTPDGSFSVAGKVMAEGRQGIAASTKPHAEGSAHMRHLNANLSIEASPDGAHGVAYVFVTMVQPGKGVNIINGGMYDDVVVKTAAGWRFKKRNFTPWMPLGPAPAATTSSR
jgi:uncharacterized protein (TIGR02246 family)